jgi:hypothetical protein
VLAAASRTCRIAISFLHRSAWAASVASVKRCPFRIVAAEHRRDCESYRFGCFGVPVAGFVAVFFALAAGVGCATVPGAFSGPFICCITVGLFVFEKIVGVLEDVGLALAPLPVTTAFDWTVPNWPF